MNVAVVLRGLATLSWIAAIVIIALAVMRAARGQSFRGAAGMVIGAVIFAILLTSVSAGLVFIQPEERGVVISAFEPKGYREAILQPGLRWIIPFAENVVTYPISRQTYTMSIAPLEGQIQGDDSVSARTSDGQVVLIDASIIFALNPAEVINIHINWRDAYEVGLVRPQSRGVIRDEASQYRIDQIVSEKRGELTEKITERLSEKLEEEGMILIAFVMRNIQFTEEYADSVEQKQIAEQRALEAEFTVEQRRYEALQAIEVAEGQKQAAILAAEGRAEARLIEAEAEKKALELIAAALRDNPDLLTFEYIQKLAPGIQVMLVPSDNPFLLPLPSLEGSIIDTTPGE